MAQTTTTTHHESRSRHRELKEIKQSKPKAIQNLALKITPETYRHELCGGGPVSKPCLFATNDMNYFANYFRLHIHNIYNGLCAQHIYQFISVSLASHNSLLGRIQLLGCNILASIFLSTRISTRSSGAEHMKMALELWHNIFLKCILSSQASRGGIYATCD